MRRKFDNDDLEAAALFADWTLGGEGIANKNSVTANLIWGANRPPTSVPTSAEVSFEVQYNWVNRALPDSAKLTSGAAFRVQTLPLL